MSIMLIMMIIFGALDNDSGRRKTGENALAWPLDDI